MRHAPITYAAISLIVLAAGCGGGRAGVKVKEVSRTIDSGDEKIDYTWKISYDGDAIEKIVHDREGEEQWTKEFTIDSGNLTKVTQKYETEEGDNERENTVSEYEWEGGQIVKFSEKEKDNYEIEVEVIYDGSDAEFDGQYEDKDEGSDTKCDIKGGIVFDDDGRLDTYIEERKDDCDSKVEYEFQYDDDSAIEELQYEVEFASYNETFKTEYKYTDEGALDEIESEGDDGEVVYDDDGRIETIEWDNGGDYSFEYDDGAASGVTFWPMSVNWQFDMMGKGQTDFEPSAQIFGY